MNFSTMQTNHVWNVDLLGGREYLGPGQRSLFYQFWPVGHTIPIRTRIVIVEISVLFCGQETERTGARKKHFQKTTDQRTREDMLVLIQTYCFWGWLNGSKALQRSMITTRTSPLILLKKTQKIQVQCIQSSIQVRDSICRPWSISVCDGQTF